MANMGCIEVNPWNSRRQNLDNPDYLVIDLDPLDIAFGEVIRAAQEVHRLFEAAEMPNYVKTSGATGLHIYVPLAAKYTYDQVREFGRLVAYLVNDRLPETTSVERSPEKRKGKIYLDFLQNRRGQTMATVYSLRPRPGAPVATPLLWEEVVPGMTPAPVQHPHACPTGWPSTAICSSPCSATGSTWRQACSDWRRSRSSGSRRPDPASFGREHEATKRTKGETQKHERAAEMARSCGLSFGS